MASAEIPFSVTTRDGAREFVRHSAAAADNEGTSGDSLMRLTTSVFSHLTVLLLGFLLAWYFFPKIEVVPVPVDPISGKPIPGYSMEPVPGNPGQQSADRGGSNQNPKPDANTKENNDRSK
jgi:hypothetical protein